MSTATTGKTGAADLARLVEQWGPLPSTWWTTSRADGSRIMLYRVPSGVDPTTWPTGAGPSIEIIRHAHRYAVVWPSIHPETGVPYRWYRPDGSPADEGEIPGLGDLAELPTAWLVGLTGHGVNGGHVKPGSRASRRETDKASREWIAALPTGQPCVYVGKLAADLTGAALREDGNAYDATRDTVLALLRAGETGHPGVRDVLLRGRAAYVETVADKRGGRAVAEGEYDRFTLGGVGRILGEPGENTGRGCECLGVPTVLDERDVDPFDGAGEGLNDGMLCAEVAKNVMAGWYRWVRGLGWLTWTGIHWTPTPDQAVSEETRRYLLAQWRRAVQRLERAKTDEERKTGEQVVASWRGTLGKSRITAITTLAQGIGTILTDPADLDAHPDLLNVGNGVVDLRTGQLVGHDPGLLLTMHTPVRYSPDATHPDWDAALAAIPADLRGWLQLRYGQGITGHMTPDDLLVVQDGGGENGKTTYAVAVRGALGDYYVAISHRALLGDPSQHPTELMSFRGARVALLEELPEERRLSVVRLKALIGTPTMKARLIRQDEVEFAASHTLFLNTNHLPVVDETDHGTWRRLARLRFPYVFRKPTELIAAAHERRGDPNLRQRLQEGRHGQHEAVLAWLVAGAVAWYAADRIMPPLPPRVVADTREWRGKSDLLLAYAAERLIFDLTAHVLAVELLADFNAWLTAHGHHEWSDRTLAGRLEEHGEFIAHNVTKKHIRANENLSRRTPTITPPPGQYKAWLGVRFRQSHDGWPDDETAGQASSVSAVSGSSDNPREISIARVIPTTRNSGNNDPGDAPDGTRPCGICGRSFHPDPPSRAVCDTCRPHLAGSFGTEATA